MLRANVAKVLAIPLVCERAHKDCGMVNGHLPSPKQMQTLVRVWKQQLWK